MVLLFLPFLGMLLYLLFRQPYKKNEKRHASDASISDLQALTVRQMAEVDEGSFGYPSVVAKEWQHLIRMNLKSETSPFSQNNRLQIFSDSKRKFEALFKDIEAAKIHVHLEYYIINNDDIGKRLLQLLTKKVEEGVQVLVLYDDIGSKSLPCNFFNAFEQAGGRTAASLPSKLP